MKELGKISPEDRAKLVASARLAEDNSLRAFFDEVAESVASTPAAKKDFTKGDESRIVSGGQQGNENEHFEGLGPIRARK